MTLKAARKSLIKKNILRFYESVITPLCRDHGNLELEELTVDRVQAFPETITNGRKPQTQKNPIRPPEYHRQKFSQRAEPLKLQRMHLEIVRKLLGVFRTELADASPASDIRHRKRKCRKCDLSCCGFRCDLSTSPVRKRRETRLDFLAARKKFSSCRTRDPGRRRGPPRRCVSGVRPGSSSMFCAQWQHFGKPVGRFPYH